jgi:hypothetical protein
MVPPRRGRPATVAALQARIAMAEEGSDDTEALLRDAQRLPWEARLTHAHWAVRVAAYNAVTAAAGAAGDITASPLSDFGAPVAAPRPVLRVSHAR